MNSKDRERTLPMRIFRIVLFFCFVTLPTALILLELGMRVFHIVPERHERMKWLTYYAGKFVDGGLWGEKIEKDMVFLRMPAPEEWNHSTTLFVPGAGIKLVYDSNPRGYFDETNGLKMWINKNGFRGPKLQPKNPDVFRILGLGDSFTFGEGVRFSDTFLHQIESKLNSQKNLPGSFEVLNLGMGGYSLQDEIVVFEKKWLPEKLKPDLVLITFYVNDAIEGIDEWGETDGHYLKQTGLGEYSYLGDYVISLYQINQMNKDYQKYYGGIALEKPEWFLTKSQEAKKQPWLKGVKKLERLVELSKQHNFDVALIIFPDLYQLNSKHLFKPLYDMVQKTCDRLKIPSLSLFPAFESSGYPEKELWVHPSDHHPNEVGHALAAEQIFDFLISNPGLLKKE